MLNLFCYSNVPVFTIGSLLFFLAGSYFFWRTHCGGLLFSFSINLLSGTLRCFRLIHLQCFLPHFQNQPFIQGVLLSLTEALGTKISVLDELSAIGISAFRPSPLTEQGNMSIYACMRAKLPQSCPTLCDPMDSSLPGSSVHGILQARLLECPHPGDLPDTGIEPVSLASPALAGGFFTTSTAWESYIIYTLT